MAGAVSATWRVQVDGGRCVGSGMCAGVAPRHFTLDGERSRPASATVGADDGVLAAAECCPMEAITISDAATGTRLFPVD